MTNKNYLKYPIKYAIMPISKQTGTYYGTSEKEREDGVIANIVSKCYVIGERKTYSSDGNTQINYEVVFLYNEVSDEHTNKFEETIPTFNFLSNCVNSIYVNQVFNTFSEAKNKAIYYNSNIIRREVLYSQSNYEAIKMEHQKILDKYEKIENMLEELNSDVEITITSTLEDLIDKVLQNPKEFYIKLADSLSVNEREYLKTLIKNKYCGNCLNGSCRVQNNEKIGLDEFGNIQGSECYGWNNYELIGRERVLSKNIL